MAKWYVGYNRSLSLEVRCEDLLCLENRFIQTVNRYRYKRYAGTNCVHFEKTRPRKHYIHSQKVKHYDANILQKKHLLSLYLCNRAILLWLCLHQNKQNGYPSTGHYQ